MVEFKQSVSAFILASLMATPAWAADDAALREELEALKNTIAKLEKRLAKQETKASTVETNGIKIKLKPALAVESADGKTSFAIDGRAVADVGTVLEDGNADLSDAQDFRYLWAGFKGKIDGDWSYRFLAGFENDSVSAKDIYLAYHGFDHVTLRAGQFKEYNGIENMSSNLYNTFVERSSAITTFRELRNMGFGIETHGKNWGVQLGVFGEGPGDTGPDDEAHSYTARAHMDVIGEKDHTLHLGGTVRLREPQGSDGSVRFRSRGESHVIDERLVDTGTISNVEDYTTYGLEAYYRYGPFALLAEYNETEVERSSGGDVDFDGGYVSLSYFLTGEQRSYKAKNGTYGRVKPADPFSLSEGGWGAWEVATRYTNLDLNDGAINGGELDAYTLGLSWYPNNHVKFALNYVYNELDENAAFSEDPQYLMLRTQVDF